MERGVPGNGDKDGSDQGGKTHCCQTEDWHYSHDDAVDDADGDDDAVDGDGGDVEDDNDNDDDVDDEDLGPRASRETRRRADRAAAQTLITFS